MNVRHILLTTDFSDEARRAYGPVASLATDQRARLTLLHVVQLLATVPYEAMVYGAVPVTPAIPDVDGVRKALEKERAQLPRELEVETEVVTADNVSRGVVQVARERGVDLIALSTHGRSGLRRVLLGSVAEEILRRAHVPVLFFPPPESERGSSAGR